MNRKTAASLLIVVALVIIGIIIVSGRGNKPVPGNVAEQPTTDISASETTKVNNNLSEYTNAELGFSVKYPSTWEKEELNSGVNFIIPINPNQVSTMATLQATVEVASRKCAFPPVTTIKDRGTVTVAGKTLDTISMSNTVQGRTYFNRMYTLQQGAICYTFSFASVALSTQSKNLTGSNATQATNNNKAIVTTADEDFTNMVKSFNFVTGPQGEDETKAAPKK